MRTAMIFLTPLAIVLVGCDPPPQEQAEAEPAAEQAAQHTFHPAQLEWRPAPPAFERGAEIAILEGDPSVEGDLYSLRLRMPPDYVIAPHTHPQPERAVVLSGEFYLGHGTEMDQETAERLDPGTYISVPPGTIHYVMTGSEGETVLHLTSTGPLELVYVDPADDPRLR